MLTLVSTMFFFFLPFLKCLMMSHVNIIHQNEKNCNSNAVGRCLLISNDRCVEIVCNLSKIDRIQTRIKLYELDKYSINT